MISQIRREIIRLYQNKSAATAIQYGIFASGFVAGVLAIVSSDGIFIAAIMVEIISVLEGLTTANSN